MARIVDKETRYIDVDFGPVNVSQSRTAGSFTATTVNSTGNGVDQILNLSGPGSNVSGSFIQYSQIDLTYMAQNNEVMQPTEVSIQRTSPVPLGFHINGNNHEQLEEFIFILSRPLNNDQISRALVAPVETFRELGLDRGSNSFSGDNAGRVSHEQNIYSEKRMYSYSTNLGATVANGELNPPPLNAAYHSLFGMPILDSVTTWGTLSAITGPQLHCYRVVIMRNQALIPSDPGLWPQENMEGTSTLQFPPVNITFLCKDPKYTESEYLTRLVNAMNSIPIGGQTS